RLTPVLLLFFLSGANGLLYQVVWVRQFVHVFGATVLAVSTVLAAFMGGLALGGAWGGRIARRLRRPLRTYGWMELGLALYAGAVPWILVLLDPVYGALNAKLGGSFWMLSTVRFALSTLVLVPPTFAMGATLPILARYAEGGNRAASGVARLYSVNTLGAVAGTVATGFVLLPEIGVLRTLALGVLVNLLLAVTAILLGRREEAGAPRTPEAPRAGETVVRAIPGSLILLTAGVLGFAALSSEILWTRVLSLALGGTAYSFVIVLAVFLLGIAGGSAWAAHLLRGGGSRAQRVFVACPAAIAWLTLALLPVFDRLPGLFMELSARGGGWAGGIAVRAVVAAIPLLPPTFLSGAAFPLAVGILRRDGVSRSVGDVYSANTLGAILGSWAAAFVLIPAFGLRGGLLFGSAVLTASSAVLLLALGSRRTAGMSVALILVTAAGMVGLPDWNRARLTRGGFAVAVDLRRSGAAELGEERGEVVFLEEGITSTITVRRWGGDLSMQMNGVTEASNTKDLVTQVVLGGLGAILHEGPQDVLVIGLGSGITAAAAASHPGVESVDCAEISEAVIRGARWFDEDADHILDDPRLRMIVGDGRNHLRLTDRTYDLIVSEPSNVWNSGVGALMTAEFFELASERLNPGGILVSWIQGYSLSSEALRSVLAAARGSFPRVSLWMGGWGDFMIVAGDARFGIDGERLLRKGRNPEVGKLLARMETPDLLSLLAKNLLAGDAVDRFVDGFPANSDDNLYLEFEAPRLIHKDTMPELFRRLQRNAGGTEQLLVNAPPGLA
ncbi:MAG: fused MFS/spermidine synthase, partial [Gemmatimonadota bacterium]|nr:fused MFS/spermidine synthase [Gemmatimonadota bacterium]